MKIYEFKGFPNPRRVRMFLAEKGVGGIECEQVDVPSGQHRKPDFLAMNPYAGVPVLELEDGSHVSESIAISRYFEERHPEPVLFGGTPLEKAEVEMWQRRIEQTVFDTALSYYHHATDGLGALETYQYPDWGNQNRDRARDSLVLLDEQLAGRPFIAGERFSVADITALCAIDFASAVGIEIPATCVHLARWHKEVSARPSARA